MPKERNTVFLGLELGLVIATPMVGFLLLGIWIDDKCNIFPLGLILGVFLGIGTAIVVVLKKIIPSLNNKKVINDNNNNK
jgi:F0F1-type ATP synthase assembly protein I